MVSLKLNYIEELKELETSSKNVNLLRILRLEHDENAFSDIIAEIIKSKHGVKLLSVLFDIKGIKNHLNTTKGNYFVYREYHRIDITIIFPEIKYIIGIENKIFADEQDSQITRYQDTFQKYYSGYRGIFLFLTPNGRDAKTVNSESEFKCYNISYANVLTALEAIKNQEEVRDCVNQLIDAIKEGIAMSDSTVKKIRKIWGNHDNRHYLEKIISNKPTILDIKDILTSKIETYLKTQGDTLDGEPIEYKDHEIAYYSKIIDKKIVESVAFIFYDHKDQLEKPFMRIIVFDKMGKRRIKELTEYNEEFSFEKIPGKPWLSLYSGKEPNYVMDEDHDYGEIMAELFLKAFIKWYDRIRIDIKKIK
jgi:hypothetical protein